MKHKLTLSERREIAKLTLSQKDWLTILKNTHKKETYDMFNIPEFKEDVNEYLKKHPPLKHPKQNFKLIYYDSNSEPIS